MCQLISDYYNIHITSHIAPVKTPIVMAPIRIKSVSDTQEWLAVIGVVLVTIFLICRFTFAGTPWDLMKSRSRHAVVIMLTLLAGISTWQISHIRLLDYYKFLT